MKKLGSNVKTFKKIAPESELWDLNTIQGVETFVDVLDKKGYQFVIVGISLMLETIAGQDNIAGVKQYCDQVTDILFSRSLYYKNAKAAFMEDLKTRNAEPFVEYEYQSQFKKNG